MSLRLFLSADLAGSTAFKQNYSAIEWQLFFNGFYSQLPAYVEKEFSVDPRRLALWKTIGDEIVFSAELDSAMDAVRMVQAFRRGAARYRKDNHPATRTRSEMRRLDGRLSSRKPGGATEGRGVTAARVSF